MESFQPIQGGVIPVSGTMELTNPKFMWVCIQDHGGLQAPRWGSWELLAQTQFSTVFRPLVWFFFWLLALFVSEYLDKSLSCWLRYTGFSQIPISHPSILSFPSETRFYDTSSLPTERGIVFLTNGYLEGFFFSPQFFGVKVFAYGEIL